MALYTGNAPVAINLFPNPSAETNANGYVAISSMAVTRPVDGTAWTGTTYARATATAATGANLQGLAALLNGTVPGVVYTVTMRVRVALGRQFQLVGYHRNVSNTPLANSAGPIYTGTGSWQYCVMEMMEAPATTQNSYVTARFVATPAIGWTLDMDGVTFSDVGVTEYIDGTQGPNYHWSGVAHASTSYRDAYVYQTPTIRQGIVKVTTELYLSDKLNHLGASISTDIISGAVEMKTDRLIKMTMKGVLRDPVLVNPYTDYIAPIVTMQYSSGPPTVNQVGLYSIVPPSKEHSEITTISSFDGRDLSWNLSQTVFDAPYTASGNVVNAVTVILVGEGFTNILIPASTKTLTVPVTFAVTMSKLDIVNALLNAIGYYAIWPDRQGTFMSFPYLDYATVQPDATYFSGIGSTVIRTIKEEPSTDGIYNKVRVIKDDSSTVTAPIMVTLTNNNPLSPTSVYNLKRTIYRELKDSKIVDLATATETAKRLLRESASTYVKYTMQTTIDPSRNVNEVYGASIFRNDGYPVLTGKFPCNGWDLPLDHTQAMTHYLGRSEEYL